MIKYGRLDHAVAAIHKDQKNTGILKMAMDRLKREDPAAHKTKLSEYTDAVRNTGYHTELKHIIRTRRLDTDTLLDIMQDPYKEGHPAPKWGHDRHSEIHKEILEFNPKFPGHIVDQIASNKDIPFFTRVSALNHKNCSPHVIQKVAGETTLVSHVARNVAKKRGL